MNNRNHLLETVLPAVAIAAIAVFTVSHARYQHQRGVCLQFERDADWDKAAAVLGIQPRDGLPEIDPLSVVNFCNYFKS